jgi:hypothetical protein
MVLGFVRYVVTRRRYMGTSGATQAIIQVTTIGNYETVNEIIRGVRSYNLPFPYQFWVVVEPGVVNHYDGADEVIVVPASFTALSHYKARAQEYSRRVRAARGLNRHDVKIIMLDDDSLPTRQYFIDVFGADYDVCEGVLAPRKQYGRFLSHMDDLRTLTCLQECAFWQGIGHPIWVHGEGLTLRGSAESVVTWNYPVNASEDLTVGQNSVERGLRFGFVYSVIQVTSPWSWSDFVKQRRRWIWGNLYALRSGLLPPLAAGIIATRWIIGLAVQILVTIGIVLSPTGALKAPRVLTQEVVASLILYFIMYAIAGWIGASETGATVAKRVRGALGAALLAPVTSALSTLVQIQCILKGDPGGFEVIAKEQPVLQ